MIYQFKRLVIACLVVSAFAAKICGAPALPPGPGYQRVKIYLGPWNSDQWEWGRAPKAPRLEKDTTGWQPWGSLPCPVFMDGQAAADGGHQYVMGGYAGEQLSGLYRNDLVRRSWDTLAPMPLGICNGAAAVVGDTLYVHGGYSYTTGGLVNRLYKYSIASNTWTSDTGCCLYNWEPCMVPLDGRLYYMGGCAAPGAANPSVRTWCYTPGAATPWVQKADMNTGRVFAHACVHNGRIYMAGGNDNNGTIGIRETEFYDPATNVWTQDSILFSYLPGPLWAGAYGCAANTFFIYGGGSGGEKEPLEYSFDAGKWDSTQSMPNSGDHWRLTGLANALGEGLVFGVRDTLDSTVGVAYKRFGRAHDLGVRLILPHDTVDSGQVVTPAAMVKNFGLNAEEFYLRLRIEGICAESAGPINAPPFGETTLTFQPVQLNLSPGRHVTVCSLSGDWFPPTWYVVESMPFHVRVPGDAGVEIIVWPFGRTVGQGSVQPRAVVRNYGNTAVTVPVQFQVWDSSTGGHMVYADSQAATIAPSGSAFVSFALWTAFPDVFIGYVAAKLPGDVHPENDRLMNWFRVMPESAAPKLSGLYPSDTIPSGSVSPRDVVTNYGQATGDFQSIFSISRDTLHYRWAEDLILGPGDTANLVYQPDWNATPGYYNVRARVIDRSGRTLDTLSGYVVVIGGAVEEPAGSNLLPKVFALDAPWPNPCRGVATICYALPRSANVSLKLYDASGRLAAILDQGWKAAGRHAVPIRNPQFTIRNAQGVYVCRLTAGDFTGTRKLVLTER